MRIITLLACIMMTPSAFADTPDSAGELNQASKHCTIGDVTSALQAFEIAFYYASTFPSDFKIAGLGGSINCQYRFFLPQKPTNGERFTFCEEDVFLGGIVVFYPYKLLGISRQFGAELLDQLESTVSFGPASGVQTARSILRTNNKGFIHPNYGNTVYMQEAFITQEQPGTYLSNWTLFELGAPIDSLAVYIDVVTHEDHLDRVRNDTWRKW